MKIGVWLNEDYHPYEGGGFSYYERLVEAIDTYAFDKDIQICFVTKSKANFSTLHHPIIRLEASFKSSFWMRVLCHLPLIGWHYKELHKIEREKNIKHQLITQLNQEEIGFIYYLTSGCELPTFPFVATHWDIGHLSTYAFPELVMDGNFERRQHYFSYVLPKALLTFVESEASYQELLCYSTIAAKKMRVVPIFAGKSIEQSVSAEQQVQILAQYGLKKETYFFYPAQFWAHKNHIGLLRAFCRFYHKHQDFHLVLTGSDKGNRCYIKHLVHELGLDDAVIFPGFVSNETINCFYQNAASLIMASFFGPTNMPPLEAIALGCPVIASDISGHREQLGDAAIYFNPLNDDTLYNAMEIVTSKRSFYQSLIYQRNLNSEFKLEKSIKKINEYLKEAVLIRSTWQC